MSDDKVNLDKGFIEQAPAVDPDLVGASKEEVAELADKLRANIKELNCNALILVQGEDGTMCLSDGNILPTKAMNVMQLICAGVFAGVADDNDRQFLDQLSQSLARRMNIEESIPKILVN